MAFAVAHFAKFVLDWLAAKTGCCATGGPEPPIEGTEENFHVTPNGDTKPTPAPLVAPVSPFIEPPEVFSS